MSRLRKWVSRFKVQHTILFPALVFLLIAVVLGGTAFAATRSLNRTIPGSVNITTPIASTISLYSDAGCTIPLSSGYALSFGSIPQGGTSPQISIWFRASEIAPSTIKVTDTWLDFNIIYAIGSPNESLPSRPCPITLSVPTNLPVGNQPFTVTITGSGG